MTTEETIDKARTAMRIMFEIAKETGLSVDAIVGETHTDSGEFTASFRIGDYAFHFDEMEGFMINYWPLPKGAVDEDTNFESEWQYRIDDRKIASFTLPPKQKALRTATKRKAKAKQPIEIVHQKGENVNG